MFQKANGIITLLISCLFVSPIRVNAGGATTNVEDMVAAVSSTNVRAVIAAFPLIEKLWPTQPEEYFRLYDMASSTLGSAVGDPAGICALTNSFVNLITKDITTNDAFTTSCLQTKCRTILHYLNWSVVRDDRAMWLHIAKCIGDIRAQEIPNYVNKGIVYINPPHSMDKDWASPRRQLTADEILNTRNRLMDGWQATFRSVDGLLTSFLLSNATRVAGHDTDRNQYLDKINRLARLTEEEKARVH